MTGEIRITASNFEADTYLPVDIQDQTAYATREEVEKALDRLYNLYKRKRRKKSPTIFVTDWSGCKVLWIRGKHGCDEGIYK